MPLKKAANGEKKTKSSTSAGAGGHKRGSSAYNVFMKSKLAELRMKYPDMGHKECFKRASEEWQISSKNPANRW